jgi:hypothetical protein
LAEKQELEKFQICGVNYKQNFCFDFLFSNGLKTISGCAPPMTEHQINPAGAHIRKIEIHYFVRGKTYELEGLRFFDKDDNTLLECGDFSAQSASEIYHTMAINEDERLVGVRSKTNKDGSNIGLHFDIEFLLCKLR